MILTENEKTLYKAINLYQKKIFRQFLIDAITNDNHPHSYESKICFLINPPAFKIIYDSQNKRALGKPNCKPSEWQNLVNDYFEDNKFTAFSIEDYFLNDCNLWLKGRAEK